MAGGVAQTDQRAGSGAPLKRRNRTIPSRYLRCTTISFASIRRCGYAGHAANVTKRLWEIGDIVDVLEAWEQSGCARG
jgi:hypothetical protein